MFMVIKRAGDYSQPQWASMNIKQHGHKYSWLWAPGLMKQIRYKERHQQQVKPGALFPNTTLPVEQISSKSWKERVATSSRTARNRETSLANSWQTHGLLHTCSWRSRLPPQAWRRESHGFYSCQCNAQCGRPTAPGETLRAVSSGVLHTVKV